MKKKNEVTAGSDQMQADFGLPTATFVVIAGMVGAGVLTTSGYTVLEVGSNEWMLLLWVLGGVTAVCGALTLAELSAALPRTGGDYIYLYETYGALPAFLSGWVSFLIGFAVPSAAAAFAFAKYSLGPLQDLGSHRVYVERSLATAAMLVFASYPCLRAAANCSSARVHYSPETRWARRIRVAGVSIGWPNRANLTDLQPVDGRMAVKLMSSMVYISYAYTGWNSASYLAGEVRDPQRRLPQAILMGTIGVTLLYLALNMVYALALSAADVRGIVDDPSNHDGREAIAPVAQIAAVRLFGARWTRLSRLPLD